MNLNLLTIDALSATPPPLLSCDSKTRGRLDSLLCEAKQSTVGGVKGPRCCLAAARRGGEPVLTADSASKADTPQSYNTINATKVAEREPLPRCCLATARRGGGFENIFKRRLGPDESRSELGGGEVGTKPQKSVASDKTEQELIAFQGVIAISAEQKQSIADGKAASSQTVLSPSTIKGNRSSAEAQAAVGGGLAAAGGNIGGVQRSVSRQAQAALGTGQSQTMPAQAQGAQQGQGQMAGTPEASSNTGSGQTRGNSAAASPRLVDNTVKMNVSANPPQAGSGKLVESANQQSRGGDTESIGLANQPGQVQSKTQPAALSAVTVTGQRNAGQAPGSVAAGGRAGGGEVTSQDRIKDKLGSDRQKGSQQITGDRVSNEPAEKLNVEKIDLFSGKNSMPKPESGGGTPQSAGGQISVLEPGQIAAGSRPLVADQSHVTANNGSTSDTAAAIREQICQSIQVSIQQGNSQITIHLNPPDLGRVSVKFSQQGNELTGLLEATNPQTRAEIRQAIPEIIRSLEESGISVKHIDVTLSDSPRQPAQESFRDNSSQDLWQQLGNQGFQNTGGNRPSPDSFVTPAYSEDGTAVHNDTSLGRNQSSPSDNLLDVLI